MPSLSGKLENGRIIIRVGIRPFQPYEPVEGTSTPATWDYHEFRALVDTGAVRTCITERVVQKLNLKRRGRADIWNIKRSESHWTYLFHLGIWPDVEDPYSLPTIFGIGPEIEGIDVGNHPYFDVLLGMDVVGRGSLYLEVDGSFRLTFPG